MCEGDGPPSPFFIPSRESEAGNDMCTLETERLILRAPRPADIAGMVVWLGDYNVSRNMSRVPHPYGEEDAEMFVAGIHRKGHAFSIVRKSDSLFMGCTGLTEDADGFEFGYWLGTPFWGLWVCHRSGAPAGDLRLRRIGPVNRPCRLVLRQSGIGPCPGQAGGAPPWLGDARIPGSGDGHPVPQDGDRARRFPAETRGLTRCLSTPIQTAV